MRVLFVAPELPVPPFTGAHTRPLSVMRALHAAGHDVIVVGAVAETGDAPGHTAGASGRADDAHEATDRARAAEEALGELCTEVVTVTGERVRPSRRRWLSSGRRLLSPVPLIAKGYNAAVGDAVLRTARRVRPEVIHLQSMYAIHYGERVRKVLGTHAAGPPGNGRLPVVVDLTDVVSGLCETAAQARPIRYAAVRLQASSSRRQERRLLAGVIPVTINDEDRARLHGLGLSGYTVPLAMELPELVASTCETSFDGNNPLELLFVGSLLHAPNRAAALFLVRELAPELRRRELRFRLRIAGRAALPESIGLATLEPQEGALGRPPQDQSVEWVGSCAAMRHQALHEPADGAGIEFCADVPDLAPLYRSAAIVLAPLPHGGGTKNKTLEAMAWSRPILGTPQAFTGIGPAAGEARCVVPLDAWTMADAIAGLAADADRRSRMGRLGRAYVAAEHSQRLVNRRVAVLYDAIGRGEGVAAAESRWASLAPDAERRGDGAPSHSSEPAAGPAIVASQPGGETS